MAEPDRESWGAERREARGVWTWPGGSFWLGRVRAPSARHRHYAMQITIAVDGPASLAVADEGWQDFEVALVASEVPHSFDPCGRFLAQVMIEPVSEHGLVLTELLQGLPWRRFRGDEVRPLLAAIEAVRHCHCTKAQYLQAAHRVLHTLTAVVPTSRKLDKRVAAMCDHIRRHIDQPRLTLPQVAAAAFLSPERARHLFREQTGLSVRAYVLWTRLNYALERLPEGQYTAVAHECGFADAAHFTRTFRHMYGITPSLMAKASLPVAATTRLPALPAAAMAGRATAAPPVLTAATRT